MTLCFRIRYMLCSTSRRFIFSSISLLLVDALTDIRPQSNRRWLGLVAHRMNEGLQAGEIIGISALANLVRRYQEILSYE